MSHQSLLPPFTKLTLADDPPPTPERTTTTTDEPRRCAYCPHPAGLSDQQQQQQQRQTPDPAPVPAPTRAPKRKRIPAATVAYWEAHFLPVQDFIPVDCHLCGTQFVEDERLTVHLWEEHRWPGVKEEEKGYAGDARVERGGGEMGEGDCEVEETQRGLERLTIGHGVMDVDG